MRKWLLTGANVSSGLHHATRTLRDQGMNNCCDDFLRYHFVLMIESYQTGGSVNEDDVVQVETACWQSGWGSSA